MLAHTHSTQQVDDLDDYIAHGIKIPPVSVVCCVELCQGTCLCVGLRTAICTQRIPPFALKSVVWHVHGRPHSLAPSLCTQATYEALQEAGKEDIQALSRMRDAPIDPEMQAVVRYRQQLAEGVLITEAGMQ